MSKKVCKKEISKAAKEESTYKCKKCGAAAQKEKHLCKPKKV